MKRIRTQEEVVEETKRPQPRAVREGWSDPGPRGRLRWVKLSDIDLAPDQRPEVSKANTLAIAREFTWKSFAVVSLSERPNGRYYAFDAGQRIRACLLREDILWVPAVIHRISKKLELALSCFHINTHVKHWKAIQKFHLAVRSGRQPQIDIAQFVAEQGLKLTSSGTQRDAVDYPGILLTLWKADEHACKEALRLSVELCEGCDVILDSETHRGFYWLVHNKFDPRPHLPKLRLMGGHPAVINNIRNKRALTSKSVNSTKSAAAAIIELINDGKRNKVGIEAILVG